MRTKITLFTMMLAIFSIGLFAQPDVWNRQEKIHSKFQKENNFQMFSESYPSQEKEIPSLLNKRKQDQLKKDQLIQSERNVLPDFLKKKEGPLFIFSSRENKQNFTSKNFLQKAKNAYNVRAEIKQRLDSVVYVERDENTNEWLTSYKNEYAYDERGNLILEAWYHWDSDTERWEGDYKSEYIYDENRNCISEAGYDWDSDTEQWEGDCKYEYTYDERGSLILKAYYRWDSDTEQWEEYNKYEYTYDERGNLILEVDYNWNNINQQWQPTYKYAVDYDYNYFNDDLLLPPYVDFKNKVVNYIVYKSSDGVNWTESGKGIYYYSDIEMAVSQISMGSIKLYPNPVVNDLNIVLPDDIQQAEFKLFDLHGRMLVTKNIVADKKVNLEKLAAGIYLYQIITEKGTYQGKLVK